MCSLGRTLAQVKGERPAGGRYFAAGVGGMSFQFRIAFHTSRKSEGVV